jgi:hypothetical protein
MSTTTKFSYCAAFGLCLFGLVPKSHAATNIVVLNSTSGDITVSCNATGKIAPGNGGWSCVDAKITTLNGDSYSVKDTHGHAGCGGGAWSIRYVHDNNGKLMANACTGLGFGQIGCHIVQVTNQGLRVSIQGNDNACAGQYATQFGPNIFNGLVQVVSTVMMIVK